MLSKFVLFRQTYLLIGLLPIVYLLNFTQERATEPPPTTPVAPPFMLCEGSLGENLFSTGDFGTGSSNIPTTNPGIAPGYNYITTGPPFDGQYVLTNNTGAWPNIFPTWIRIRDNSSDPNGYMMVVNASFEPGIFYSQEITDLCANTTFEFSADVINVVSRTTPNHIKPNISFFINDELKFSSGDIPQDETWKTYGFTFTTGPTDTNLTLSIRNNAPGGAGNDLALDNITFRPCGPEAVIEPLEDTFVCLDEDSLRLTGNIISSSFVENFIQWQVSDDGGASYGDIPGATAETYTVTNFNSGTYLYRFIIASTPENLSKVKCRVFSFPKLVTVFPKSYTVVDTICSGLVYETETASYTQTGIYLDTLQSSFGCDSIVTLDLTVVNDPMIEALITTEDPSCFGFNNGSISIDIQEVGYPPYSYSLNDSISSAGSIFTPLPPGGYQVRVQDKFGCFYEENLTINDPRELTVDVGQDTMLALGTVYQLQANASYRQISYQWTSPFELSCTDCPKPTVLATNNGVITLQVTNETGCTAVDSLNFSINTSDSYRIYAPNAFSPNADGINDRYTVFSNGLEVDEIEVFQIYDRWGNLLFDQIGMQAGDIAQGWDGFYKNQRLDMGVYIYRIDVRFIDGTNKIFTGSLSLIR